MNFREILSEASFNGIRFEVEVSEANDTTTFVIHKYPGSKRKPKPELIGDDPLIMPITSFLLGEDRFRTWDLLRTAKKKGEVGKLIHPTLGLKNCYLSSIKAIENNKKIGRLKVILEFIEAEPDEKSILDGVNSFISDVKDKLLELQADFIKVFSIVDMPAYAIAQTAQLVNYCRQFISSANGLCRLPKSIDNLTVSLDSLGYEIHGLIRSPKLLADDLSISIGRSEPDAVTEFGAFAPPKNIQDQRVKQNARSLESFVVSSLVIHSLAKAADREQSLESEQTEALAILIEAYFEEAHDSYFELKVFLSRYHELSRVQLEKRNNFVQDSKPSVLLSYELYGDLDHEFKGKHPLFVGGMVPIEVS